MEKIYEYKKVNVSLETPPTVEATANRWGAMGWRTVAVMLDHRLGYAHAILVEREKENVFANPEEGEKI